MCFTKANPELPVSFYEHLGRGNASSMVGGLVIILGLPESHHKRAHEETATPHSLRRHLRNSHPIRDVFVTET